MKTLKTILAACLLLMGLTAMAQPSILPLRLKADGKLYLPEEKLWPDQKPYGEASSVPGWLEILSGKECYRVVLYADADAPLYAAFELMELIRHEGLDFVLVCNSAEEDAGCFMDAIGYAAALWTPGRDAAGSPINTACTLQFEF